MLLPYFKMSMMKLCKTILSLFREVKSAIVTALLKHRIRVACKSELASFHSSLFHLGL